MNNPCKECPFRRTSAAGYLGEASHEPEVFLNSLEHTPIPCHMIVDWEQASDDELEDACWNNTCVGSLQYLKNQAKLPRNPRYDKLVREALKNPDVFTWKIEFINHHSKP